MTDGNSEPVEVFLGPNRKTAVERAIAVPSIGNPHFGVLAHPCADVRGAAVLLGSLREQRVHTHLEA